MRQHNSALAILAYALKARISLPGMHFTSYNIQNISTPNKARTPQPVDLRPARAPAKSAQHNITLAAGGGGAAIAERMFRTYKGKFGNCLGSDGGL